MRAWVYGPRRRQPQSQGITYDDKTLILTEGWNGIEFKVPYAPLQSRPHIFSNAQWVVGSKEFTAPYNRLGVGLTYREQFIARLHLECRGNIYGCRHYEDVFKVLKEIKADRKSSENYEDGITILDSSKVKYVR